MRTAKTLDLTDKVTETPPRIPELGRLDFCVPTVDDEERITRRIYWALAVVTILLGAVASWPWWGNA